MQLSSSEPAQIFMQGSTPRKEEEGKEEEEEEKEKPIFTNCKKEEGKKRETPSVH